MISVVIVILSIIGIILLISSFSEEKITLDKNYVEWLSEDERLIYTSSTEIQEYNSEVSVGYLNPDGTKTIYVFSAPIRYINSIGKLKDIDSRIVNVTDSQYRKEGYIYSVAQNDIESLFPKEFSISKGIRIKKDIRYEFGIESKKAQYPVYEKERILLEI